MHYLVPIRLSKKALGRKGGREPYISRAPTTKDVHDPAKVTRDAMVRMTSVDFL